MLAAPMEQTKASPLTMLFCGKSDIEREIAVRKNERGLQREPFDGALHRKAGRLADVDTIDGLFVHLKDAVREGVLFDVGGERLALFRRELLAVV